MCAFSAVGSVHWAALARSTARALGLPKDPSVALAHLCLGFYLVRAQLIFGASGTLGFLHPFLALACQALLITSFILFSFFPCCACLVQYALAPISHFGASSACPVCIVQATIFHHAHVVRAPCVLHLHTFSFWRFKRVPLLDSTLAG